MRGADSSLVSAPLSNLNTNAELPPAARILALHLLHTSTSQTRHTLYFIVEAKTKVKEVYAQTCIHFASQGMLDTNLFGLAIICDGEYLFVDHECKMSKYAPKSWKSSHTHGLDANGRPGFALYFRIQFYVDSPLLLQDEATRHYYYLQLRHNVAARTLTDSVAEQVLLLAGLALQADLGDRNDPTITGYFCPDDYLPAELRTPYGIQAAENYHLDSKGMSVMEAENQYIQEAFHVRDPVNAHVFRLRSSKNEPPPGTITLAVCARDIKVCPETNPPSTFLWSSIGKLSFERKKFEIRTGHEKLTLYTSSDEKSKLLLSLCRETHQFSMAIAPRLSEAKKQEEEQKRCFQDFYSRMPLYKSGHRLDQRISVISSTSSNTTSGIVSDRVHSEDELEIMINCPPAPSMESLALAHLIDSCQSSLNSSLKKRRITHPIAHRESLELIDKDVEVLKHTNKYEDIEESSGESCSSARVSRKTPKPSDEMSNLVAITSESQCSSNCSTVVVSKQNKSDAHDRLSTRRLSTSSSIELGFSHTAQNSTISDAATFIERDMAAHLSKESASSVYVPANTVSSQTSGVYTMNSSENADALSSNDNDLTYDNVDDHKVSDDLPSNMPFVQSFESLRISESVDQVDSRFRDRSSSVFSNMSFRGDGTDPTDRIQALSAEELSDLIVGRGVYPSHKSVSNTLDSDSDYVTISSGYEAPPPVPPKRFDSKLLSKSISINDCSIKSPLIQTPSNPLTPTVNGLSEMNVYKQNDIAFTRIPNKSPPPYPYTSNDHHPDLFPISPVPPPPMPPDDLTKMFIPDMYKLDGQTSFVAVAPPTLPPPPPPPPPPKPITKLSMPYYRDVSQNGASLPLGTLIAPNNYIDVSANKAAGYLLPYSFLPPPPPPQIPRQPPPPPPPVPSAYNSQITHAQFEQYKKQMYSDVDFVVFPVQDPSISQQEYLDAKQGSLIAALAANQAYSQPIVQTTINNQLRAPRPQLVYHTPSYLNAMPHFQQTLYASTQNLSETYLQLPGSIYSPPSLTSTNSLEPPKYPQVPKVVGLRSFARAKSDDNILMSAGETLPRLGYAANKRMPPPPPPPLTAAINNPMDKGFKGRLNTLDTADVSRTVNQQVRAAKVANGLGVVNTATSTHQSTQPPVIDISTLREKSKNLDLPLISALCNDKSLLKQTKAFVLPKSATTRTVSTLDRQTNKHLVPKIASTLDRNRSRSRTSLESGKFERNASVSSRVSSGSTERKILELYPNYERKREQLEEEVKPAVPKHALTSSFFDVPSSKMNKLSTMSKMTSSKMKYPVSGSDAVKKKISLTHRHPNDKLPDIPRAASNTYVVTDHKTVHSNS